MSRRKKTNFEISAVQNDLAYMQYFDRFLNIALSVFQWDNLPDTVDPRYMESALFYSGRAVFFQDDDIGFIALNCTPAGVYNSYGYPTRVNAYSVYDGYKKFLTEKDSVVIFNNYARTPSVLDVQDYAIRLWDLDRIIAVNARAQKTPVLILADEKERMSMLNLYKEYDGNAPVIFGGKNLDLSNIKSISTGAPYVADRLQELKTQIWNEALTYLGVTNVAVQKKERMIRDEVNRMQGGTIASRFSRLQARRDAAEKINNMFGLNIEVNYRLDFVPEVAPDEMPETEIQKDE